MCSNNTLLPYHCVLSGPRYLCTSQLLYLCFTAGISPTQAITAGNFRFCRHFWFYNLSFFGVWNLDFFRIIMPPICISERLTELQALCLDYVVAILYPLLLTVLLYICIQQHARGSRIRVCLCKPFTYCFSSLTRRFNWNPSESLVHVFASFLLLSSTKILFVSLSLLKTVQLYEVVVHNESQHLHSSYSSLFYDTSISFFSKHHLPYALLALCISSIFVVLPCFILVMYPTRCFQKCLNYLIT